MENVYNQRLGSLFSDMLAGGAYEYFEPLEESEINHSTCPSSHGSLKIVRNDDDQFSLKCACCDYEA